MMRIFNKIMKTSISLVSVIVFLGFVDSLSRKSKHYCQTTPSSKWSGAVTAEDKENE